MGTRVDSLEGCQEERIVSRWMLRRSVTEARTDHPLNYFLLVETQYGSSTIPLPKDESVSTKNEKIFHNT